MKLKKFASAFWKWFDKIMLIDTEKNKIEKVIVVKQDVVSCSDKKDAKSELPENFITKEGVTIEKMISSGNNVEMCNPREKKSVVCESKDDTNNMECLLTKKNSNYVKDEERSILAMRLKQDIEKDTINSNKGDFPGELKIQKKEVEFTVNKGIAAKVEMDVYGSTDLVRIGEKIKKNILKETENIKAHSKDAYDYGLNLKSQKLQERPTKTSKPSVDALISPKEEVKTIYVGLDFGTHCTKVCYKESNENEKEVKYLDFGHNLKNYESYTMPSLAYFSEGSLFLCDMAARMMEKDGSELKINKGIRYIKTILAGTVNEAFKNAERSSNFTNNLSKDTKSKIGNEKYEVKVIMSMMIAYLFKEIKRLVKMKEKLNDRSDFVFNICVPVSYMGEKDVLNAFEDVFTLAQKIETDWNERETSDLLELAIKHKLCKYSDMKETEKRVFAVGEAIAEITPYARLTDIDFGHHVIIDIGSGTIDISMCYIDKYNNYNRMAEEREVHWIASRCFNLGVSNLEQSLKKILSDEHKDTEKIKKYFYEIFGGENKTDYKLICGKAVVLYFKKTNNGTDSWKDTKIHLFGGGSYLPGVKENVEVPWMTIPIEYGKCVKKFPIVETQIKAMSKGKTQLSRRLALAYGLTFGNTFINNHKPLEELYRDCRGSGDTGYDGLTLSSHIDNR